MNGGEMQLPPGFRFHPTDEELVTHYLCRKCAGLPLAVAIIAEIDLYKHDPWHLPGMALYGEREWYFFSPRDRKYPNGSRPNRAARSGYWKATGADKPIGSPKPVAIKKALVFYSGKAPRGEKTNWIMHEYRLADVDRSARRKTHSLRLDDWVLCRIYNKKGGPERKAAVARRAWTREEKPRIIAPHVPVATSELVCFEPSESLPRLHADSSGSEFTCESREVESQPRWEMAFQVADNNGDAPTGFGLPPLSPVAFRDPLHDIFMYLQKPF